MFSAIGRFFRSIGYMLTGRIDAASSGMRSNPHVVRATFDHVVSEKKKRIQQYKSAVAAMIAQEEKKKASLKTLTDEVAKFEKLKTGAAAMARKVVQKHNGDIEAVKADPEYLKCQAAYKDFSNTLEEKEARCVGLEEDIQTTTASISDHKNQLRALLDEIDKIKDEQEETVADIVSSKEEKELADMISGISEDRTSQELQQMRDLRQKAKAGARVSREMAGIESKRSEEEFLEYATRSVADSEFDALIGLSDAAEDESDDKSTDRARLPES